MYLVMAIGDEGGVNFNIEANDVNNRPEDEQERYKSFKV